MIINAVKLISGKMHYRAMLKANKIIFYDLAL